MINIKIEKKRIEVVGHANQAKYGSDVVCASVSTAVTMTINQIELFNLLEKISYELKPGYSLLTVIEDDEIISKIINNLVFTLKNLELQYPKYLKINETI